MGSPDPRLREDVIKFLDVAQSCATNHSKLLNELTVLYENTLDPVAFFKTFFRPLSNILLVYTREPSVERVVSFVAGFAVRVNPKGLAGTLPLIFFSFFFYGEETRGWEMVYGIWTQAWLCKLLDAKAIIII